MKQKMYIIGALILLFAVVTFMIKDLFFTNPENKNPCPEG